MYKIKKYIGLALMMGALASVHTWAASEEDFEYDFSGSGVIITEYLGGESQVEIPSTIEGTPVTAIGNSAFAWNTDISKVTVPASVMAVEVYAFSGCVSLTSLYFMGNAPACGAGVFNNCPETLVVYYDEGTTGWGDTFGGRKTVPRQPVPPVTPEITYSTPVPQPDGSLTFVITYTGTLEWSSDMATWSEVEDATPEAGEYTVNTQAVAARFYRVKI